MSQEHSETKEETWSKFEDNLIDFIRANPILYATTELTSKDVARANDELWKEFSEKWNYSVRHCKMSWTTIKTMHLKAKRGEYENSPTYKKYMDDRLSFLEHLDNKSCSTNIGTTPNLNTKNVRKCCSIDKVDNNIVSKPKKKKKETAEIDSKLVNNTVSKPKKKKKETVEIDSNTSPGDCKNEKQQSLPRSSNMPVTADKKVDIGEADSETFTDFEKKLIDYVENKKKKKETTEIEIKLVNNIVSKPKKKKKETVEIDSNTSPVDCKNEKQQSLPRSSNMPVTADKKVDIGEADSETFTDFEKKLIDYVENKKKKETTEIEIKLVNNIVSKPKKKKKETVEIDSKTSQGDFKNEKQQSLPRSSNIPVTADKKVDIGKADSETFTDFEKKLIDYVENKKKKETTEIEIKLVNNIVSKPKKKKKETVEIDSETLQGDFKNEKQQSLPRSSNIPVTADKKVDIGKADSETFTDFENKLIDYVKDYPILYDSRNFLSNVGGSARRIQVGLLWDKFSAECGTNGYICHKRWHRMRLTYFRVRKLQDETVALKPSDFKYLDGRFVFLEPMYRYIKTNSINVFSDKTHTIKDDNYTPPTLKAIESNKCLWSEFDPLGADFDRRLVDFVKKHRVLYDPSAILLAADSRVVITNRLWSEVGVLLNSSGVDCCLRWRQIKDKYVTYLKRKITKGINLPRNKQFKQMSFYDVVYFGKPVLDEDTEDFTPSYDEELIPVEPKEEIKVCHKVYGGKKHKTPVLKNPVHEDTTQSNDEELITVIPKEEINIYDSLIEFQDEPLEENVKPDQYSEEPQLSASMNTDSSNSKDSNASTVVSNINDEKCDSKEYKRRVHLSAGGSSACESTYNEVNAEPKNVLTLLSQQELSNSDFFREIGRFVSNRFSEAKQKEIRNKSWALVTEVELAMLQEDQEERFHPQSF